MSEQESTADISQLMPKIISCTMEDCCFNSNQNCHALAINVGEATPMCDTFKNGSNLCGVPSITGSVGACKLDTCSHNQSLECTAPGIKMSNKGSMAECITFSPM